MKGMGVQIETRRLCIIPRLEPKKPLNREPPRTKLEFGTSKYCPHCLLESGGSTKQKRKRDYTINGPLHQRQCDPTLQILLPRISWSKAFWNRGPIWWLIAPPWPPTDFPWYESRCHATCPVHGRELVLESSGVRQFGRLRLPMIWLAVKLQTNFR